MHIDERIQAFSLLGEKLHSIDDATTHHLINKVSNENPWFTPDSVKMSLTGVRRLLGREKFERWTSAYPWNEPVDSNTVALVLAGNIPLVGFHDILCVLISGHKVKIKLSAKDSVLTTYIIEQLIAIEPRFKEYITVVDKLKDFDAVIATGSDNSSRYFEYYFRGYPSIIRKNRTSCAIISGNESAAELEQLGVDIFSYFGLGCRNVSKLFLPEGYPVSMLFENWKGFETVIHHHKYANNYDYQKAIMMVNKTPFFDNGFILLTRESKLVSPLSVLYYDYYSSAQELKERIELVSEKIQCVVGNQPPATIPFGEAQFPDPDDYADRVDTMEFLLGLR